MEDEPKVQFRLGDWATDPCDHPQTAPGLPKLWAAVATTNLAGWASLGFHWTGSGWAPCEPISWEPSGGPTPDVLRAWASLALDRANAAPRARWVAEYHDHLRDTLNGALAKLEWDELQVRHRQEQIQQLECALAAAEVAEPDVAAIAHRLLRHWTGTADALVGTARALAAEPEGRTGKPSRDGLAGMDSD